IRPPDRVRTSKSKLGIPPAVQSRRRVAGSEPPASALVPNVSRASSTSSMLRWSTSLAESPNSRSAAPFQEQISPPSVTVYAASAVCSSSANNSVSSIALLATSPAEMLVFQRHVGQTGIRAQDKRLSTRYERFIVAPGAPP